MAQTPSTRKHVLYDQTGCIEYAKPEIQHLHSDLAKNLNPAAADYFHYRWTAAYLTRLNGLLGEHFCTESVHPVRSVGLPPDYTEGDKVILLPRGNQFLADKELVAAEAANDLKARQADYDAIKADNPKG